MEKITATQFESIKEGLVTTSFEMLDVNGDNVIDEKDLQAAQNAQIRSDIQKLLDTTDEEPSVDTYLRVLKQYSLLGKAIVSCIGEIGRDDVLR